MYCKSVYNVICCTMICFSWICFFNLSFPLFKNLKFLKMFDINVSQECTFIYKTQIREGNLPDHFITYF